MRMVVRGVGLLGSWSGRSGLFLMRHVSVLLGVSLGNRVGSLSPSFLGVATSAGDGNELANQSRTPSWQLNSAPFPMLN